MASSESAQPQIKVIGKIGQILALFRDQGPELRLQEIAHGAKLDATTASRIVNSLCKIGILRFDELQRIYSPGLIMIELSHLVVARFSFHELVHRELLALSNETRWSSYLGILDDADQSAVIYIDSIGSTKGNPARTAFGQRLTAHTTASGKLLLAFNHVDPAMLELAPRTRHSHTDVAQLRDELATIRRQGYSITDGEEQEGWCAVAAPLIDSDGIIAAIGVETDEAHWEQERPRMIKTVVAKAKGISAALRLRVPGTHGLARNAG